ncbi:hypothetical protein GCM10011519_33830 [Marmoricola endophyticus]|uniref:Putative Flp pilus-assembly TadG-like N-terminal domain-containing protein n=1 Tax=Marmoricola endophyticus TaxID=2040280 RepID=A0A917FA81_9ACTN|nr:pilus assembly protein TadG-related protein [Marmoricola endophyticus]GGF57108.1 hypothetical protein GCM10011519_33830 [Marmoricola endophyticus]
MTGRSTRRGDEGGSVTPLIIGFALVLAVLVAVVVDASAAYLRRQSLDHLADSAALAATDGIQGREVYTGGLGAVAEIDEATARRYAAAFVAASGAERRYPGLRMSVTARDDVVVVRLAAPMDLPLSVPGVSTPRVTGSASSEVRVAP